MREGIHLAWRGRTAIKWTKLSDEGALQIKFKIDKIIQKKYF